MCSLAELYNSEKKQLMSMDGRIRTQITNFFDGMF